MYGRLDCELRQWILIYLFLVRLDLLRYWILKIMKIVMLRKDDFC